MVEGVACDCRRFGFERGRVGGPRVWVRGSTESVVLTPSMLESPCGNQPYAHV